MVRGSWRPPRICDNNKRKRWSLCIKYGELANERRLLRKYCVLFDMSVFHVEPTANQDSNIMAVHKAVTLSSKTLILPNVR
jgi:hypothetical protein